MRDLRGFEVNEEETLQDVIIEDKVYVEVTHVRAYMLLSPNEGKSLSHFHDKFLQVADDAAFQFRLRKIGIRLQAKKLCHYRILDKF